MEYGAIILGVVVVVIGIVMLVRGKKQSTLKIASADESIQEMRYLKPTKIKDAVEILTELGETAPGYKHFVELIGTTGSDNPAVGPFSGKQVAFYDATCYEIVATEGMGTEENVASHERSTEQFFITDGSCDAKVYIDLASFGSDVKLVSMYDRIEDPNSDISQRLYTGSRRTSSGARFCVAEQPSWTSAFVQMVNSLSTKAYVALMNLMPKGPMPAFALAGVGGGSSDDDDLGSNVMFAQRPPAGFGGGRRPTGGFGGGRPPQGFGGGGFGVPRGGSDPLTGMLLGMALSGILQQAANHENVSYDRFRGYHLVENGIPLNYQVYMIGELREAGGRLILSKATGDKADVCYFSTRPEDEVIADRRAKAALNNKGCAVGLIILGVFMAAFGIFSLVSYNYWWF